MEEVSVSACNVVLEGVVAMVMADSTGAAIMAGHFIVGNWKHYLAMDLVEALIAQIHIVGRASLY